MRTTMRDVSDAIGPTPPPTPEARRNAALTVAERARDVADAQLLLAALGLDERGTD